MDLTPAGREIEETVQALAEQLEVGLPLAAAVDNLPRMTPTRHTERWRRIAERLRSGASLASQLGGWWPDALVSAIKAGEQAGRLPEICHRIHDRLVQGRAIGKMAWRVAYPAAIMLGAAVAGLFILLWVVPQVAKGSGVEEIWIAQLSRDVGALVARWGWFIGGGMVAGLAWLVTRLRSPAFRAEWVGLAAAWPVVGPGLRQIQFGLWSYQLAMLHATGGFEVPTMLRLSAETLPSDLRRGVERMADDLERQPHLGLRGAADPERTAPGDPRRDWPFYIVHAFSLAHETGRLDKHLSDVAPKLIEGGTRIMNRLFTVAQYAAMALAAALVGSLFLSIYAIQFGALNQAMGRH